ncbi:SMC family ATPase [Rhodococcus sp. D2-41]|uniref:AAA family ATPase n=1 Tax=Speluncibacter jeojiensis TaxID=2710754 RepID=UPI0024105C9F|nr:SMC family ATPase [Rhodococcus sp. D2-41]MDG3012355.1 SMC family ATPase [Rhodococcus sp. D2-41]
MRLHSLEMTAFGPFADTQRVDFDALGADGLFLLHGNTGAGKTTILDAVAFALYGTVPGARKDGRRLLSDHAPAGTCPEVRLELTLGGERFRLVRRPGYERPKKRGEGTITEQPKATLEWLTGDRESLSRIPDIAAEIGRMLGMSADQFFQVALLPQGEFARFLRAETDERGVLLERLFDTSRFGSVEAWFADRRRDSAQEVERARRRLDVDLGRLSTAAGVGVRDEGEGGGEAEQPESGVTDGADPRSDPARWAQELLEGAELRQAHTADEAQRAQSRADAARAALDERRTQRAVQERRDRASSDLERHEAGAERRRTLESELDAARRATAVTWRLAESESAHETARGAARRLEACREPLQSDPESLAALAASTEPDGTVDAEALAGHARDRDVDVARLDDLVQLEHDSRQWSADLDVLRGRLAEHEREQQTLATAQQELPGLILRAEAAVERARAASTATEGLTGACERATDAATAARELVGLRLRRGAAAESASSARAAHLQARERLLDVREARLSGMAAELAGQLVSGEPCTVCGSMSHPEPAGAQASAVTKDDEAQAQADEQIAAEAVDAARRDLNDLDAAVDLHVHRCSGRDLDELEREREALVAELAATRATAEGLDAAMSALSGLRGRDQQLQQRGTELAGVVSADRVQVAETQQRITAAQGRLDEARGGDRSVGVRRDRLVRAVADLTALAGAVAEAASTQAAAARLDQALAAAAEEAGFASLDQAIAAVRPDRRRQEIDAELTAARDVEVAARAVLSEPEVQAMVEREPIDLTEQVREAQEADLELKRAVATAAEAGRRAAEVRAIGEDLRAGLEALAPLLRRHDELAALAEVIAGRGQNTRKMSLRSYVLAARLEQVAVVASERLRRMSGGRYEFVHSDEVGSRGRRGGLGLDIRDDYTGAVRSAKTLSGGESFMASLALALALADVVSTETGGISLDTLFIDEGFGTLDADTLDAVMGVLDELREGGRVVGLVSHVDEMRQRIPSRLHVIRGKTGSTLQMVAP